MAIELIAKDNGTWDVSESVLTYKSDSEYTKDAGCIYTLHPAESIYKKDLILAAPGLIIDKPQHIFVKFRKSVNANSFYEKGDVIGYLLPHPQTTVLN